jgi:hypothetical protein
MSWLRKSEGELEIKVRRVGQVLGMLHDSAKLDDRSASGICLASVQTRGGLEGVNPFGESGLLVGEVVSPHGAKPMRRGGA